MTETEQALLALVVDSHNRWMDDEVAVIRATNAALLARLPQGFQPVLPPVLPPRALAKRTTCLDCGNPLSGRGAPQRCKLCERQRRRARASTAAPDKVIMQLRAKLKLWRDRCQNYYKVQGRAAAGRNRTEKKYEQCRARCIVLRAQLAAARRAKVATPPTLAISAARRKER